MRNNARKYIVTLAAGLALAPLGLAQTAAKTASGSFDPHDLSGVWAKARGFSIVMNNPPPMTPAGKDMFDSYKPSYGPRSVPPALGNDPTGNCDPLGMPRNLFLEVSIYKTQFLPTPGRVIQFF